MQIKIKNDLLSRRILESSDFGGFVIWYEGIFDGYTRKFAFFVSTTNPFFYKDTRNKDIKLKELKDKAETFLSEFIENRIFNDINRFQLLDNENFEYISDEKENDYFSKFVNFICIENEND